MKRMYQVTYEATYWVSAENEEEAEELAIEQHEDGPDGCWTVMLDPYASPLEALQDGTYSVDNGEAYLTDSHEGYWVAVRPVEALSDVPSTAYLGVWTDVEGKRYYDQTEHINDRETAIKLGQMCNQFSIWDCANKVAIPITS